MQASVEKPAYEPRGSITPTRVAGSEAPLRKAIGSGQRLLVCTTVRFADRTSGQPLWLTDRRFLFTRKYKRATYLVSIPVDGSALTYEPGDYPLKLHWTDEAGRARLETFRSPTWKDSLSGTNASVSGGASGGIAGALIGLALDAGIGALVRKRESPSRDEHLHTVLLAAMQTPADVRPVDLSHGSISTSGGRAWIAVFIAIPVAFIIGSAVYVIPAYVTSEAYRQSAPCAAGAQPDCRLLEPGVVIDFRGAPGKYDYCYLWIAVPDRGRFEARYTVEADLHNHGLCGSQPLGRHVSVEYFRGSLTGVLVTGSGPAQPDEESAENPEYTWRTAGLVVVVGGLIAALSLTAAVVSLIGWLRRRSLLQQGARQAGFLL